MEKGGTPCGKPLGSRLFLPHSNLDCFRGQVVLLALVLRPSTTNGATAAVILKQWIVAGASATEFSVFFDQNLDGDSGKAEGEQRDGQNKGCPFHEANLTTTLRFLQRKGTKAN